MQGSTDGSDLEWLGLERRDPGEWTFLLTPALSRLDGKFYGGTGIAVAAAVMEAETGRRALWTTVQYVSSAATGAHMRVDVSVQASGRRTSQVQVTGWEDDRLVFTGLGAAGSAEAGSHVGAAGRLAEDGDGEGGGGGRGSGGDGGGRGGGGARTMVVTFGHMPDVPEPSQCPPWGPSRFRGGLESGLGWLEIADARTVAGGLGMWMRLRDRPLSRPAVSFLADVIPSGVVRAAGRTGAGSSLDNTLRFCAEPDGDWMLVEVEPHMISSGYLHGAARLWSATGRLIGVASQTAGVMLFD